MLNLLLVDIRKYYSSTKLFRSLDEHAFDQSPTEIPHKRILIEEIVRAYA